MGQDPGINQSVASQKSNDEKDVSHALKSEDIPSQNDSQILNLQNITFIDEAFAAALEYDELLGNGYEYACF